MVGEGVCSKMDPRRVERTLLHRRIGLFGYSREFVKHGILSPYVQIVFIGRIIRDQMENAQQLPSLIDNAEIEKWLGNAVEKQVIRQSNKEPKWEPLDHLALVTARVVAWNPYRDFAELLNVYCGPKAYQNAAHKLSRHGYEVSIDALSELAQPFLTLSLGQAVRSFDPQIGLGRESEWLTTVFYRFALKHVISDRQNRQDLDELHLARVETPSPAEELEAEERESALSILPEVMGQLPEGDRRALELYFGFHGRDRTLSEVAHELGTSPYLVRAKIVHSLGSLASKLGIQRDFDDKEYCLVQMLFGEGMDVTVAAKRLRISERETRDILERVNEKFTEGLRSRTKKPWKYFTPREAKEEMVMSNTAIMSDEEIVMGLKNLSGTPELRPTRRGLQARLSKNWVRVERVREAVLRRRGSKEFISSLEEQGVDLGWLITPDPSIERADLPGDYYEWAEELQQIAERSWIVAEALYIRSLDEAAQRQVFLPEESKEETVERVYRALAGVSQAIEAELPRKLRRTGKCYFRMDRTEDKDAVGRWESDSEDQSFEMKSEIQYRAGLLGELPDEFAEILSEVLLQGIFEEGITLPSFRRVDQSASRTVWLELLPRTSDLSLHAVEVTGASERDPDYADKGATTAGY